MAKVKTKIIYRNKELEKRISAKEKADAKAYREKKKKANHSDPIAKAHKESSKSPKKMFKESMKHFNKLTKK